MRKIRWIAKNNRERGAISRLGNEWTLIRQDVFRGVNSFLIENGSDLRWISVTQEKGNADG